MKNIIYTTLFLTFSHFTLAQGLQECRKINSINDRVSCYDTYADSQKNISQEQFGAVKYKEIPENKAFKIVDLSRKQDKYIMTMDNHQVWRQTEIDRKFRLHNGDTVIISSGLLSSYFLKKENGTTKIKVKRIK